MQYSAGKAGDSFTIPEFVTSIYDRAFYGCRSLTSIVIPDSVTTIGERAFYGCDSLSSIVIPDSVTTIGDYAFYYCTNLSSVVIGESVTTIGDSAFEYCSITDVYYTGSEAEWQLISISDESWNFTNATKHYNYVPENN